MRFSLARLQLTVRERTTLLLAAALLIGAGLFYYMETRELGARDTLTSDMRTLRATLSRAASPAELQQLRAQKVQLEASFKDGRGPGAISELPVQIAAWALQADVAVLGLAYEPEVEKTGAGAAKPSSSRSAKAPASDSGSVTVHLHRYDLRLRGTVSALHGFLVAAGASSLKPQVEDVQMTEKGDGTWDLALSLVVTSLEQASP